MKTIIKITAIFAFMFTTVASMANEPKHSLTATKDAKSFVFHMDTQSNETTVKLIDTKEAVIYFEKVANKNYDKKFNVSQLENGSYTLKVENSLKVIAYSINIEDGLVNVLEVKENVKPIFRSKENMVYVNLLNLDKKSVEIKVYDSENRLVFGETLNNEMLVEKAFNFENALKDSYTVVVKDSNDTYYKEVIVD
ncbi:hypothetical protein GGR42_001087 [Saonia flava]|uniref:Por secretion system C-terminal sorting domain-containing protein n=1 Tax=Saonia flava TaxID=523696 RepID=A0A846QYB9_9FLAO|nr:hypothetical protein [Saonia flava]NJB70625.1 hypothetical protein [Saonia flava]